jgi:hypothetical protein
MLRIDIPTLAEFKALAIQRADACVSLYLPTSPLQSEARANRCGTRRNRRGALYRSSQTSSKRQLL